MSVRNRKIVQKPNHILLRFDEPFTVIICIITLLSQSKPKNNYIQVDERNGEHFLYVKY